MDEWAVLAGPWLAVLGRGVTLTVQLVKGRPRLTVAVLATSLSSLALYRYVTRQFGRWEALGVPHEPGHFPYGSFNIFNPAKKHLFDHVTDLHLKFRQERYCGWFLLGQPVLNINDPELLRIIMVKDFNNFVERSSYDGDTFKRGGRYDKLWSKQLTGVQGEEWKHLRSTFSPIFTSGKMKGMLRFIQLTADHLVAEMELQAVGGEEVALKDLYGRYTMDGIAATAFGMDTNSFENKQSIFLKHVENLLKISGLESLALGAMICLPGFARFCEAFNINVFKKKETKFFYDVILSQVTARREGRQERRNDLVDLMMDALAEEEVEEPEEGRDQYEQDMALKVEGGEKPRLDEDSMVATAMVFMMAGYDTTASTLSYASYLLSSHPAEQERLQEEVDQAFAEAEGAFPDYTTVQGLPYLDMVIHETLRLHSPVGMNSRESAAAYTLPGTGITLRAGDLVSLAPGGLHRDPAHWARPDTFHPEHFSKEGRAGRSPYVFQAFGQGPRNCIGMRFALLEAKVALIAVLHRFTFLPGTKTQEPLKQDPTSQLCWPVGGLWARLEARQG